MAGRNRMNFGRDPGRDPVQYQAYPYGDIAPQQLGPSRDSGMGGRGSSSMRRGSDLDPLLSRRLPGPSYQGVYRRAVLGRGFQGGLGDGRLVSGGRGPLSMSGTEPPNHTSQQNFNGGVNRLPYEQGGLMRPGAMGGYNTHSLPPMRGVGGVGAHNYGNVDSYGLLNQQKVQLSDGSLRTVYSVPESGSNQPSEAGLKGVGGFRGGYVGPDALAVGQSQKPQPQGMYQGRQQLGRDRRLMHMGGWEEDARMAPALSPRAMPMSPRRDGMVRMMSPTREELTPPMSPRRNDFVRLTDPRGDDISPPRSPRRREYPPVLDYGGRLPLRRGFSPSREEDFLIPPRVAFPMSPRRISPPMSPRGGWDFDVLPLSPSGVAPMSPRRESPSRSPIWGRARHNAKAPSQWDVPPAKNPAWNGATERQTKRDTRRDYARRSERNVGYGGDTKDPKGWPSSRRDEGRFGRGGGDYEDLLYRGSGRTHDDHPPPRYGMTNNNRPNAYNSVVNQRVGLVTKYIERERAERAAKESADKTFKDNGRKRPSHDDRPPHDSSRPARPDRHNEKDTLAAAIAKTTATLSKQVSTGAKKPSKHERNNAGPTAPSGGKAATPAANTDRSGGGERTNGIKPPVANLAETSAAAANGTAAAGASAQPSSTVAVVAKDCNQETKVSKTTPVAKAGTEDTPKKNNVDDNSGRQSNGATNNPVNGNTNTDSKSGGEQQREPAVKRPSLVMEIERATKSRKLAEQQKNVNSREVEETYYDANELSADFVTKTNKAGSRFSRMINDDPSLKRRYEGGGGGPGGLHCLVCGKGSKTYSDIFELITHAQQSQAQSKRIDHMGFRKALIDVLKLDIKEPPVSNNEAEEDAIVWPPIVVVENTRTGMGADRRWEGVTNSEMAVLLNELGHLQGRAKSIWDKFGHRGLVHVEYEPTLEGLQEAERLHNYFLQNGRSRVQWDIIRPFKTGLPGFETVPEGPDFTQLDEVTQTTRRVLYGYLALKKDVEKIFSKKQRKKVQVTNLKEVKAKLLSKQSAEQVVISLS